MTPELWQYFYYLVINVGAGALIAVMLYASGAAKFIADVILPVFNEISSKDTKTLVFSWKKGLTALVGVNFVVSNIGYVWFGAREMTSAANGITAMVFGFYFGKGIIDRINIGKAPEVQP